MAIHFPVLSGFTHPAILRLPNQSKKRFRQPTSFLRTRTPPKKLQQQKTKGDTTIDTPENSNSPYAPLVASLPDELRSADKWDYPGGLYEYLASLSQFIGADRRVGPVMNAAGVSVADWHRSAIDKGFSE